MECEILWLVFLCCQVWEGKLQWGFLFVQWFRRGVFPGRLADCGLDVLGRFFGAMSNFLGE